MKILEENFEIEEKRVKEDIKLEKEYRIMKFEEEINEEILNRKLRRIIGSLN